MAVISTTSIYLPGPQWVTQPSGLPVMLLLNSHPPMMTCLAMKMPLAPEGLPFPTMMEPQAPLNLALWLVTTLPHYPPTDLTASSVHGWRVSFNLKSWILTFL